MKIIRMILLLPGLWGTAMVAQQTVASAGGDGGGSGGKISFTVGQLAFAPAGNESITVNAGVQHAYEVFVISDTKELPGLQMKVYPNPSAERVTLNTGESLKPGLVYQLFDGAGNLLQQHEIVSSQTDIALDKLPAAGYLLRVLQADKEIKVFKIVKNQ